jgi:hypothetical protein
VCPILKKARRNTGVLHGACGRTCVQDDDVKRRDDDVQVEGEDTSIVQDDGVAGRGVGAFVVQDDGVTSAELGESYAGADGLFVVG